MLGLVCSIAMLASASASATSAPENFGNFEPSQTNPIRISPDGQRLFVVNTPAATLSVFSLAVPAAPILIAEIPVGLGPVSVNPRSRNQAWVVNQVSDSVSVVSVRDGIVTHTIPVGDEPADVVFANGLAYVSVSRENRIAVFTTWSRRRLASIPVFGGNPQALAVSPDGSKVYAAFALAGNGTTVIPATFSPAPPAPTNPELPAPPWVSTIIDAADPEWANLLSYTMPDNDVVEINAGFAPTIERYYSRVGTTNFGLAVNPVSGNLFVANTEALNLVEFEPNLRGHFVDNRITRIDTDTGVVVPFDLNPDIDYDVLPNPAALATALAQPTAVVFDPSGDHMYVAAFGTDRVAVVDTLGQVVSRIEIGGAVGSVPNVDPRNKRGPRGLALHADSGALYVLNRISNTVSIINTANDKVVNEFPVGFDPTPEVIKQGRGFLFDAKLSGNGTASCASCHIDADMDHLAWNLGDRGGDMSEVTIDGQLIEFHPMKGPMTTQSLRGLRDSDPLHWRGDRADFTAFNGAFDSLMGGPQLSEADMAAFADYIGTILFQPNPNQKLDRTFAAEVAGGNPAVGFTNFVTLNLAIQSVGATPRSCNSCHLSTPGPGSDRSIDTEDFNQPLKVPQLRNLYQKQLFNAGGPETIDGFGLDHDGRVPGLNAFMRGNAFALYSEQQARDIIAYLLSVDTGTAPAVGYSYTFTVDNIGREYSLQVGEELEIQAIIGNIDLIARGTVNGVVRGLLYDPEIVSYVSDEPGVGPYTGLDLKALVEAGDTITLMGVLPGTGVISP